jgi:hypothetical protein
MAVNVNLHNLTHPESPIVRIGSELPKFVVVQTHQNGKIYKMTANYTKKP